MRPQLGRRRLAGGLVVLAIASACGRQAPARETTATEDLVPVVAQPAERGTLRAVIHASGVITPAQGAEFLAVAPEPARIQDVTKMQGEAVASGEVLVRFALPSAAENLARQNAEVARAQAQLESARVSQARTRDFVERGLVARQELSAVDREFEEAQATLARAEEARKAAESAAAAAVIRAPFAGVVAQRLKNPGDLAMATPTDPVLRLVDPQRLEITASIPPDDVPRVVVGATARLAGPSGSTPVRLTVAVPPVAGTAGSGSARLVFEEVPALAVDTPVEVDIDAEERSDVVFVPPEAIVGSGANAAVYVAVGSQARRRLVTVGISEEERVEITSGVEAGDLVITRGQTSLPDGSAISVQLGR
jgi:RND family efflux transporter MFP subunit